MEFVWGPATTLGSSETHSLGLGLILSWYSFYCRRFRKFRITKDLASCFLCIILVSQILFMCTFLWPKRCIFRSNFSCHWKLNTSFVHTATWFYFLIEHYWIEHLHYFWDVCWCTSVLEGALFYIFNFASLRCSIK